MRQNDLNIRYFHLEVKYIFVGMHTNFAKKIHNSLVVTSHQTHCGCKSKLQYHLKIEAGL